ncbi:MAG: hypothetical protein ACI8U4_002738 [Natronomonas sp.]|jgi:hypothetical protein
MDALFDPDSLRHQAGVDFHEEQTTDDPDTFDYFAAIGGLAAVGVTNDAGAVLLMNSPHGWRLPYGPVEADEDWIRVGRHVGTELTGADIEIAGVERVTRLNRREPDEEGRETTSYDIVLGTAPVSGEPVDDAPEFGPWDELEVDWFGAVPDDAYWDHGDAVDDIRSFIE